MTYTVEGEFKMGSVWQSFKLEVKAASESIAEEKVYAELGSKHKVKRRFIKLKKISGDSNG